MASSSSEDGINNDWRRKQGKLSSLEYQLWYMYQNEICTNLEIVVSSDQKQKIYKCHQLVVARLCPDFQSMIEKCHKDVDGTSFIHLNFSKPDLFLTILEFAYTDTVQFDSVLDVLDIWDFCKSHGIKALKHYCENYISKYMDANSAWLVLDHKRSAVQLTAWAKAAIGRMTSTSLQSPNFPLCKESSLLTLLKMENLNISEVELVQAVLRWLEHHLGEQPFEPALAQEMLGPCLQHIRFLTLTPAEFTEHVTKSGLLSTEDCLAILINLSCPGNMPLPSFICESTVQRQKPECATQPKMPLKQNENLVREEKVKMKPAAEKKKPTKSAKPKPTAKPTQKKEPVVNEPSKKVVNPGVLVSISREKESEVAYIKYKSPFEYYETFKVSRSGLLEAITFCSQVKDNSVGKPYRESVHIIVRNQKDSKMIGYQTYHGPACYGPGQFVRVAFTTPAFLRGEDMYEFEMIFRSNGPYKAPFFKTSEETDNVNVSFGSSSSLLASLELRIN